MRALLLLASALALGGCTSIGDLATGTNPVPVSAQVVVLQADTTADAAYNVAAQAYLAAAPDMSPTLKAEVKPLVLEAYQYVTAADKGQLVTGQTSISGEITAAQNLIDQVNVLLGKSS